MTRLMTHLAETSEDLAETIEDLVETLEDLTETTETTGIWPVAGTYHGDLADGRPLLQVNAQTKISEVNLSLRIR